MDDLVLSKKVAVIKQRPSYTFYILLKTERAFITAVECVSHFAIDVQLVVPASVFRVAESIATALLFRSFKIALVGCYFSAVGSEALLSTRISVFFLPIVSIFAKIEAIFGEGDRIFCELF